jgi:hypothetical protein
MVAIEIKIELMADLEFGPPISIRTNLFRAPSTPLLLPALLPKTIFTLSPFIIWTFYERRKGGALGGY